LPWSLARLLAVVAITLPSSVEAATVRIDFTAELESTSSELTPAPLLQGYFRFDSSTTQVGTNTFLGTSVYTELLDFVIETPQEDITTSSGLVTELVIPETLLPGGLNRPLSSPLNRSFFFVNVGAIAYPPAPSANVLPGVSNGIDFNDTVNLSFDFPWVPAPLLSLRLNLETENEISILGGLLHPSTLDQTWTSELTLYNQGASWGTILTDDVSLQGLNYSATYNITSLSNAPEPTAITLLSLGMLLPLLIRHRA